MSTSRKSSNPGWLSVARHPPLTAENLTCRLIKLQIEIIKSHPALLALLDVPSRSHKRRQLVRARIAAVLVAHKPRMSRDHGPAHCIGGAASQQRILDALCAGRRRREERDDRGIQICFDGISDAQIEVLRIALPGPASGSRMARRTQHARGERIEPHGFWLWATDCFIFSILGILSYAPDAARRQRPRNQPPPEVEVASVIQKDVPIYGEWVATLDGYVNAQIQPQVTGYLIKQDYREGSLVHKDDVLFEIDPRPFQAVLDQAKAQLAQAEAQLGNATINVKRDIPEAQASAIPQSQLDNDTQTELAGKAAVEAGQAAVEQASAESRIHESAFLDHRDRRHRASSGRQSCRSHYRAHGCLPG